jgi:predicted transcriptional regulator
VAEQHPTNEPGPGDFIKSALKKAGFSSPIPMYNNSNEPQTQEEVVDALVEYLNLTEPISRAFIEEALVSIKLFDSNQHDYGHNSISTFGVRGILVRLNDKVARLINLIWDKDTEPLNETTEDSWRDTGVYSTIAILVGKGIWAREFNDSE